MNIQTQDGWFLYDGLDKDFKLTESRKDLSLRKTQKINIIAYILVKIETVS